MPFPVANPIATLSVRADAREVRRAARWLEANGSEHGVPADPITRLDHCLDEALANVIAHGGATAHAAPILLKLEVRRDAGAGEAEVTVIDAGAAFDPLAAETAPRPRTLAEAKPGGLGILMMRSFADRLSYRRDGGRNHLSFTVRWSETS